MAMFEVIGSTLLFVLAGDLVFHSLRARHFLAPQMPQVSVEIILGDCFFFPSYRRQRRLHATARLLQFLQAELQRFHCSYRILRSLGCRVYAPRPDRKRQSLLGVKSIRST